MPLPNPFSGVLTGSLVRPALLLGMDTSQRMTSPLPGMEPMIDIATLAEYLGVPIATIYDWRTNRRGPASYRFGKRIMYALSDVAAWVEQQREDRVPTAQKNDPRWKSAPERR